MIRMILLNCVNTILIISCLSSISFSQALSTDRPDATESSTVMNPGVLQLEMGYINPSGDLDNANRLNGLLRLGLLKNFEFRMQADYQINSEVTGISILELGTKIAIAAESSFVPQVSLLAHVSLSGVGNAELRPSKSTPKTLFLLTKTINDFWSISSNLGYAWDESGNSEFLYSISNGFSITEDLGVFLEYYGNNPSTLMESSNFIDFGATLWLLNDLQLDFAYAIGLDDLTTSNFFTLGASIRFFEK